jgi:hypothetical protein
VVFHGKPAHIDGRFFIQMYETGRKQGGVVVRDRPVLLEAHPNIAVGRVAPFRQRGDFPVLGAIFDVHGIVGVEVYHAIVFGVLVFARNEPI